MVKKSQLKRGVAIGTGILLLAFVALFATRNLVIRNYANKKLAVIENKYQLSIHYKDLRMDGLNGLQIDDLSVVPLNKDTFLKAKSIDIKLELLNLLLLKADVRDVVIDRLQINFIKTDSITSNFDFLFKSKNNGKTIKSDSEDSSAKNSPLHFGEIIHHTFDMIFKVLPSNGILRDFNVTFQAPGHHLSIGISEMPIKNNRFRTEICATENNVENRLIAEGILSDSERDIEARLFAKDTSKVTLPFLSYKWGADLKFDTLAFEIRESKTNDDARQLTGHASVRGLTLFHERISPETVLLNDANFSYRVKVGDNYFEVDSSSVVRFNVLNFNPYLRAEKDTSWRIKVSINKQNFPSDELFSSLPKGLFSNLEGIKTSGNLSYHFLFDVNLGNVDSLIFESTLTPNKFRILSFGNTDLRKMNEPFTYTAYENGRPVRSFETGSSNPNFRPLTAISPLLQMAVMQSEDGAFFYHNGFLPDAIRESLIHDIKVKKFARGGSTISMQLIKNVFLSRNKNIARKLEEALIVWLIERNRLTPKERMFEVYMNIIEWGPVIYGAQEASRFYFAKEASDLNANEAIFLASIIPKPKRVRWSFTDSMQLNPALGSYFRLLGERLLIKGVITEEDAAKIKPEIVLSGPAKDFLFSGSNTTDSIPEPDDSGEVDLLVE